MTAKAWVSGNKVGFTDIQGNSFSFEKETNDQAQMMFDAFNAYVQEQNKRERVLVVCYKVYVAAKNGIADLSYDIPVFDTEDEADEYMANTYVHLGQYYYVRPIKQWRSR